MKKISLLILFLSMLIFASCGTKTQTPTPEVTPTQEISEETLETEETSTPTVDANQPTEETLEQLRQMSEFLHQEKNNQLGLEVTDTKKEDMTNIQKIKA